MLHTEKEELYTVYDHNNGQFRDFSSIEEMLDTMAGYCYRKYGGYFSDMIIASYDFEIIEVPRNYFDLLAPSKTKSLYVVDFHGKFLDKDDLIRTYSYRKNYDNPHNKFIEARDELIESNLVVKCNNLDKIKKTYAKKKKFSGWSQEFYYARVIRGQHRHIHTISNRRKVAGVLKDEGEPVFRGKQRNLPTYWDDLPLGVWKNFKSWKHNSKRKKQWKSK